MCKVPALLLVLLLSLYPCALRAQTTNASITGRVTDPSKATVPDAKVAAVNLGTNFRYESATNGAGEYALANLPPGTYRIEVEKFGFKKLIRPDVILHVQDALAIDFALPIGATIETGVVQAGAPLVNTTSATVSTVVDRTFVENIPLNGRSFQTLIMLTPGVVVAQTDAADQGQFSVNGQRADANYFSVDGVSANFGVTGYFPPVQAAGGALPALSAPGGTNNLVSVDAMQEFRVQTSSFAPEFGRTPGGQISIVTRSGTNQFHGTAFEYFRNSVLDANDGFSNRDPLPKPEERQNDFGGVFGGPILRDKTFFFFSYEGLRLRQPATQETVVPETASRQQAPATIHPYLNAFPISNGAELGRGTAPSSCPSGSTGVCFPLSSQEAAPPTFSTTPPVVNIVVAEPHLKLPRTYEWNVAVEQLLGSSQSISLTYVGAIGRDLLRTTILSNPNPDFTTVQFADNTATSDFQALQVKFQRRLSQGLQALASYTFSHSIDIASTDAFTCHNTPNAIANPSIDRGNSDFDIRHAFTAGVTYALPTPEWNKFARATLGGWSLDAFVLARSAPPVDVVGSLVVAAGVILYPRPNVVPGQPFDLFGSQYPGGKIFNQAAFTPAPAGQQGDFGRNVLRGFGATQADVAFHRQFRFTEQLNLRFRAEFFNIFNHPNFGSPNNNLTDPLFGHSTKTLASSLGSGGANGGLNPLYQIGGPRSIQLALKLAL